MQAEYQALSDFSKEAVFVRLLVQELDFMGQQPVVLFCDNTAAIQLAKNQNYQTKTRYIKVAYHIIRDFVKTSRSTSREFGSKKPELSDQDEIHQSCLPYYSRFCQKKSSNIERIGSKEN
jgi:hypothetical protein